MRKSILIPLLSALLLGACADFDKGHQPPGVMSPLQGVYGYDSTKPLVFAIQNHPQAEQARAKGGAAVFSDVGPVTVQPQALIFSVKDPKAPPIPIVWSLPPNGRFVFRDGSITFPGAEAEFQCARGDGVGLLDPYHFRCLDIHSVFAAYKYTIKIYDRDNPDAPPVTIDPIGINGP